MLSRSRLARSRKNVVISVQESATVSPVGSSGRSKRSYLPDCPELVRQVSSMDSSVVVWEADVGDSTAEPN